MPAAKKKHTVSLRLLSHFLLELNLRWKLVHNQLKNVESHRALRNDQHSQTKGTTRYLLAAKDRRKLTELTTITNLKFGRR